METNSQKNRNAEHKKIFKKVARYTDAHIPAVPFDSPKPYGCTGQHRSIRDCPGWGKHPIIDLQDGGAYYPAATTNKYQLRDYSWAGHQIGTYGSNLIVVEFATWVALGIFIKKYNLSVPSAEHDGNLSPPSYIFKANAKIKTPNIVGALGKDVTISSDGRFLVLFADTLNNGGGNQVIFDSPLKEVPPLLAIDLEDLDDDI